MKKFKFKKYLIIAAAVVVALVALRLIREGRFAPLTMDANPNLRLTRKGE